MRDLIVNPVFRDKIPPLTEAEFDQLEQNILEDGVVREPLVVWNGVIVDGHHRWKIIQKHPEVQYTVKEVSFEDEWAAIAWMCANQLGRRNISDVQRTVLLGELYRARKSTHGGSTEFYGNQHTKRSKAQNGPLTNVDTAQRIADEQGVGRNTVKRAEQFVKGLDAAEDVSPGFRENILSGKLKAPKQTISEIRRMNDEEKLNTIIAIEEGRTKIPPLAAIKEESKPEPEKTPYMATQMEHDREYNASDFEEETFAIFKDLDRALEIQFVLDPHETISRKEIRKRAMPAMKYGHEIIRKYEAMIREMED